MQLKKLAKTYSQLQQLYIYRRKFDGKPANVVINAEKAWYLARLGVDVERIA